MIEDFFLGMSNDEIFEKYPGNMVNHVNIIDYLKRNAEVAESNTTEILSGSNIHSDLFKPKEEQHYFQ